MMRLGWVLFGCLLVPWLATAEDHDKNDDGTDTEADVCGLWFAKSSIPGAGLGMYAGRDFQKGNELLPSGDVVVPVVDIRSFHPNDKKWIFLWDEYTWNSESLFMELEGDEVSSASFGFGAAVNCFLDLVNVDETYPDVSSAGLHRSNDPGAGAFSVFHNRQTLATTKITAGDELFASYGNSWFTSRSKLPPIPLKGDLNKGNRVILRYRTLSKLYHNDTKTTAILKDMWESFVWKNPFEDTSRILFGIPKTWEEVEEAKRIGLWQLRRNQHRKDVDWLQHHGVCGDNIVEGKSTLAQAGRGALATRHLAKDSIVSAWPLIHLPFRDRLKMAYKDDDDEQQQQQHQRSTAPHQLLVNYCMGHNQTTMLLCPYATLTALINHNQTQANVYLRWADPERSNHNPEWLNKTPGALAKYSHASLAMELVAMRDISPGEEVFLDYGQDWEDAWNQHVGQWQPVVGAQNHMTGDQLYESEDVLRTAFEQIENPYPPNVRLRIDESVVGTNRWKAHWRKGTLKGYFRDQDKYRYRCDILRRTEDAQGNTLYTGIVLYKDDDDESKYNPKHFYNVPKEAFSFADEPYTSDMHLPNAFRQPMGIPDDLLPEAWKNVETS